uniref:Uncharacterized protein n=1 Tax=Anopheles arabiensis TaxID=7173 RepID=A0A182HYD0_ANOAR
MVDHMVAAGERAHITNLLLLLEVVGKIPTDQQLSWSHHIRGMTSVDLFTFSDYMVDLAEDAARLTTIDSPSVRGTSKGRPTKGYVHAHVDPDGARTSSAAKRLYRERRHFPSTSGSQMHQVINNYHQSNLMSALFRIVPVTPYGPGVMINSFAFLDEGSSMTLMDEDLAKQLGVKGERRPLCIKWTVDTTRVEPASMMIDLQIGPVASTKRLNFKAVRTVSQP